MVCRPYIVKLPEVLMFHINIFDKSGSVLHKEGINTVPLTIPASCFIDVDELLTAQDDVLDTKIAPYNAFAIIHSSADNTCFEATVLRSVKGQQTWMKFKSDG